MKETLENMFKKCIFWLFHEYCFLLHFVQNLLLFCLTQIQVERMHESVTSTFFFFSTNLPSFPILIHIQRGEIHIHKRKNANEVKAEPEKKYLKKSDLLLEYQALQQLERNYVPVRRYISES